MNTTKSKVIRARAYSRTSGKDYTSISTQKEAGERFINMQDGWIFTGHYIDEHKSGAKVEGRLAYQKAIKDLTNDEYDILCPYDISRYGRDGLDIIRDSEMLKRNFGKYVVDTKGQFDNRTHNKVMTNFVFAGVAEAERLSILDRTMRGRIKNAEKGLKWTAKLPVGRGYDKDRNPKWFISEKGKMLQELLPRYADGESLASLAREYGIKFPQTINRTVRQSQLSGIYHATFNSTEVNINQKVKVSQIPEVISPELEKRCRERAALNHKWNKQDKRKYVLTGFVYCSHCGHSLKGRIQGKMYYNHYHEYSKLGCPYCSIRGDFLEPKVFDYLFKFFLDEPAFNEAVNNAMPSDEDRQALLTDIRQVDKQIAQVKTEISNLVNAVARGADVNLLLSKQNDLKSLLQILENRKGELNQTLSNMPDPQQTEREAKLLRLELMGKYMNQDWRNLSYEELRRFLRFLFGVNPKKNNYGIFVGKVKGEWQITFEGCAESNNFDMMEKVIADSELATKKIWNEVEQAEKVLTGLRQHSSVKPKTVNK